MFDALVPKSLLDLQLWFAKIIETPLQSNNHLPNHIAKDAEDHIAPSKYLSAKDRIEIYHQQYWWRLLEVMQENFPAVTRLFGYRDFNAKIAGPYLEKYPSQHHTLNELGNQLPEFLEKYYSDPDKNLVLIMSQIDLWTNQSYTAAHHPLNITNPSDLIDIPLMLQPHIHLLHTSADFLAFRDEFLNQPPEYYETNSFPELKSIQTFAIIFRCLSNHVSWKYISEPAYLLLSLIKQGKTISESCKIFEEKNLFIGDEIAVWFYEWMASQFFCCATLDHSLES